MSIWIQQDAVSLCQLLEPVAARNRCHVALTGGLLYKDGPRKDCDIVVYFEGRKPSDDAVATFSACVDRPALLNDFWTSCQLQPMDIYTRVVKCLYRGKPVDLLFPELDGVYDKEAYERAKELVAAACLSPQTKGEQS